MPLSNQEKSRLWAKVVARAWADEAFKAKLLSGPAAVLKDEGIDVPPGVSLAVVEDSPTQVHLVLPAMPADAANLDDVALGERLAALEVAWCLY